MDTMGICAAFYYMDDAFYDLFDFDWPDWEDDIYYNMLECGLP
jgi:hypothetical protein